MPSLALKLLLLMASGASVAYYVDTVNGNDSNDGNSSDTAFATLFKAYDTMRTNDGGNGTIYVSSTQTNPVNVETLSGQPGFLTFDTGRPTIRGLNGNQWYMGIKQELPATGWATGAAPVYSRNLSGAPNRIFVIGLTDANGEVLELTQNVATPTTPAQGEYGTSGATIYVRLPADQNPNDAQYTVTYSRRAIPIISSCELFTIRDCNLHFAQGSCLQCDDGVIVARDCEFKYGAIGVGTNTNADRVDCYNCIANDHTNDGYNHNAGIMNLYNCTAKYNGDEGASPHQASVMNVIGGEYSNNGHLSDGGAMTAANSAELNVDGATLDANIGHGALYGASSSGEFVNNTVTNTTLGSGSGKGFECNTTGTVTLSANTFTDNATTEDTSCN